MNGSRASSELQKIPDFCELLGLAWMNILADLQSPTRAFLYVLVSVGGGKNGLTCTLDVRCEHQKIFSL